MSSTPTPEFSRRMTPDQLGALDGAVVEGDASAAECAALAHRFAVPAVMALRFALAAEALGGGRWRVFGTVEARLQQTCVVTLEPLETAIVETVDRRFVPARDLPAIHPGAEMELDAAMADGPDGFTDAIDFGEIAAEAVALAIDPYPRKPDASFDGAIVGPAGVAAMTDEAARPFAGLASLKSRPREN